MLEDVPADVLEAAHSILAMDAPRHGKQRRLIGSVLTPRRIALIEQQTRDQARRIVVPEQDREQVAAAANALVGWNDPEFIGDGDPLGVLLDGLMTLHTAAFGLIEQRRSAPADDLVSAIAAAEVDGQQLTGEEIAAFFVLLCVAGNDTTRQTSSHTILALQRFPEQREILRAELDATLPTGVEELVRWATPVLTRSARIRRAAHTEQPRRLRWWRPALLPGQPPGQGAARLAPPRAPHAAAGPDRRRAGVPGRNFINGIKRLPARFAPA